MRTFPKELAELRRMVESRGAELRLMSSRDLLFLAGERSVTHVDVQGRPAKIAILVMTKPDGSIHVVVQGSMPGRWFRRFESVALDGFRLRPDGRVEQMPGDELYKFE